ncbi:ankyrin repeat and LEM domain-containing protein 1-like [Paramacrobiotus metropolitanus]|uniref:ankyrin repeat and LEM domain-containing protein 1-like n=1 Tax=Paramacrobiotus metropolitanus TaxID=2943436 RepID=UPI0024458247|nr:ankyrin repeat and LEM domain-containing protein 1-like [Paramacrobiotus metropolitanus]
MRARLINAVKNCDERKLERLIQCGADPSSLSSDGDTALHEAAKHDHANHLVELLLRRGANPNQPTTSSRHFTPVHYACIYDQPNNLRILLSYGGDLYRRSTDNLTAMDYAQFKRPHVMAFLREHLSRLHRGANVERSLDTTQYRSCVESPERNVRETQLRRSRSEHRSRSANRSALRSRQRCFSRSVLDSSTDSSEGRTAGFRPQAHPSYLKEKEKKFTSAEDVCADTKNLPTGAGVLPLSRSSRSTGYEKFPEVYSVGPTKPARRSVPEAALKTPPCPDVTLSEMAELGRMTDSELRQELKKYGYDAGRMWDSAARMACIKDLAGFRRKAYVTASVDDFGQEMLSVIRETYSRNLLWELEDAFLAAFPRQSDVCQYGNYLLLDPQITRNLPYQFAETKRPNLEMFFRVFLRGIFYIGSMKTSQRPHEHLRWAKLQIERNGSKLGVQKLCRIRSIWNNHYGVVLLNCFPFVPEKEAFTRETLMVEAVGLEKVTNEHWGTLHGSVKSWPESDRLLLGSYFLKKAFYILLEKGERQIFREEI